MSVKTYTLADFAEDGITDDPLPLEMRVPLVTSPYPRWNFITSVVVSEVHWEGVRPTDHELRMIGSFHQQYIDSWYLDSYKAHMREKAPFDLDGGANGVVFMKRPDGGWGYRRMSWRSGPLFVPDFRSEPASLVSVMDRALSICGDVRPDWVAWKAARPELFGGQS